MVKLTKTKQIAVYLGLFLLVTGIIVAGSLILLNLESVEKIDISHRNPEVQALNRDIRQSSLLQFGAADDIQELENKVVAFLDEREEIDPENEILLAKEFIEIENISEQDITTAEISIIQSVVSNYLDNYNQILDRNQANYTTQEEQRQALLGASGGIFAICLLALLGIIFYRVYQINKKSKLIIQLDNLEHL